MSEMIDATARDTPGHFLLQAIVQGKAQGDHIDQNPVKVQLLVNGVELPFRATLENLWNRAEADLEARARAMAERMVTEAGLEGVADALREVEWKVKEALSNATGDVLAPKVARSAGSTTHPALSIVEDVCQDFDGNGIFSVGSNAALRAMAYHWADHLVGGRHSAVIISRDIDEMKQQLEVMRVEIMRRCLAKDLF